MRWVAFVVGKPQKDEAFCDARTKQIVRDETAWNDASFDLERMETAEANSIQERVVVEHAQVYAADWKTSNGATANGIDERCQSSGKLVILPQKWSPN